LRRADLVSDGPGRGPSSRGYPEAEELVDVHRQKGRSLPLHHRGRRCARCGRRLGDGGWTVVGVGTLCRECVRTVSTSWTIRKVRQDVCPKGDKG